MFKILPKIKNKIEKRLVKEDLLRVQKAVTSFESKKDTNAVAKKRGMDTEAIHKEMKEVKIAKLPEEITRTVTKLDLLPPPSAARRRPSPNGPSKTGEKPKESDVPLEEREFLDGDDDVYAVEEVLSFFVPMRMTARPNAEWTFPDLETLRKVFEDVRGSTMHLEIMSTMVNCKVDPTTKVATMDLNTKNLTLFQLVRQKIRDYSGFKGVAFDTYEKSAFIEQHGLTIYIPAQYKAMPVQLIMGILQKNHPQMNHPYKILEKSTFKTEGPNPRPGRSRIGDQIVLLEGSPGFMEALSKFPEKFPFEISRAWKLTIRGGRRSDQARQSRYSEDLSDFSEQFKNSVLVGAAEEKMEDARRAVSGQSL